MEMFTTLWLWNEWKKYIEIFPQQQPQTTCIFLQVSFSDDDNHDALVKNAFYLQSILIALTTTNLCGLRREIVVDIEEKHLSYSEESYDDNGNLLSPVIFIYTMSKEKSWRRNGNRISMLVFLFSFFSVFITYIHSYLLLKDMNQYGLWINIQGNGMEFISFTYWMKKIFKAFNSFINVTWIQFRRMNITHVLKDKYHKKFEHLNSLQELMDTLINYLNVDEDLMKSNYNHHDSWDGGTDF